MSIVSFRVVVYHSNTLKNYESTYRKRLDCKNSEDSSPSDCLLARVECLKQDIPLPVRDVSFDY